VLIGFRIWEGDNSDKYSMAVSSSAGGANEYLSHASAGLSTPAAPVKSKDAGMAFMVMSNELSTAKILFCPSDNIHTGGSGYATNYSYGDLLGIAPPPTTGLTTPEGSSGTPTKISYFINGDCTEANPEDLMTGDSNIGNNGASTTTATAGYRFASTAANVPLTSDTAVGLTTVAFDGPTMFWSWTANDFHQKSGNIGLADGSCQSATISGLHQYLANSTNSAAGEAFNFPP